MVFGGHSAAAAAETASMISRDVNRHKDPGSQKMKGKLKLQNNAQNNCYSSARFQGNILNTLTAIVCAKWRHYDAE